MNEYPRRKVNSYLNLTAPNINMGGDVAYPDALKIDGAQTAVPIVGGTYAASEVANGAAITLEASRNVGLNVSDFKTLRGTIQSNKAITVTVWQNPVRYNGNLHWLSKTDVSVTLSTAQGGGVDIGAIPLKGGRIRITVTNAGTATTDLAIIHPALYLER